MGRARRRQLGGVDRLPSGRWRVRLADPVSGARVSMGTFPSKSAAEVAFAQAVSDQQRGAWVAPDKGRVTLADYAGSWLDTRLTPAASRCARGPRSCTRASFGSTSCLPSGPSCWLG